MEITENKINPPVEKEATPIVYDPTKRYRWPSETTFGFNGGEFGVVLNSLRQVLSTKEAQAILQAARASEIIELALKEAVESGIAIEDTPKQGK